ncbi:MAG: type 4a pilus biogenesis protein PilO [Gemmatimonadota bacterium]
MAIQLPKDKQGQQKLLLGIVPFLIFFGYYQFMHGKKTEEVTTLETRLEAIETRNNAAKAIALTGGPELQQKLALYEQHMKRLEELIPKNEEVAALLNGLSERAMDSNVDLALMKPELSDPGQFYTQQTYQINVIGVYHDIARYLAAVASLPRIVTPVELALKPRGTEMSRDGTPKLQANFRIVTYVIPEAPEVPAAPATTPASPGGAGGTN